MRGYGVGNGGRGEKQRPMTLAIVTVSLLGWVSAAAPAETTVLVVGGSGRVGSSTARWLSKLDPTLRVAVGGRSAQSFESARSRLPPQCEFVTVDLDGGDAALAQAVAGHSLVVHTAGPFQQRTDPSLMRAAIKAGIPY